MTNNISYTYIRTEKDNKFILFLLFNNDWMNQEIDLSYSNKKIKINCNDNLYYTNNLSDDLIEYISNTNLDVILVDNNSNFLAETTISYVSNKI